MKCPYCNEELKSIVGACEDTEYYCQNCDYMTGDENLWEQLTKYKQALNVAVDALKHYCTDSNNWSCIIDFTGDYDNAPSEFSDTALEQIKQITETKGVDR